MKQEYTKLLADIIRQMSNTDHVKVSDIPNIDLYMDQVTHFMDEHLSHTIRHEDDKILTKTMINNYAKNKLLPPPEKKRYTQEHMLVLLFIYYMKSFLPLNDIQAILTPITNRFFNSESSFGMEEIYSEIYALGTEQIQKTCQDILSSYHLAANSFSDSPEGDQEFLHLFAFICLLGFDIYEKKQVIERMIDLLPELSGPAKGKNEKNKSAKTKQPKSE